MSVSGRLARSGSSSYYTWELHCRRIEYRRVISTVFPSVHHVRPLLQHVTSLMLVLGLVVNTARAASVFMRQALLDPITIEADLVQQR